MIGMHKLGKSSTILDLLWNALQDRPGFLVITTTDSNYIGFTYCIYSQSSALSTIHSLFIVKSSANCYPFINHWSSKTIKNQHEARGRLSTMKHHRHPLRIHTSDQETAGTGPPPKGKERSSIPRSNPKAQGSPAQDYHDDSWTCSVGCFMFESRFSHLNIAFWISAVVHLQDHQLQISAPRMFSFRFTPYWGLSTTTLSDAFDVGIMGSGSIACPQELMELSSVSTNQRIHLLRIQLRLFPWR